MDDKVDILEIYKH